MNKNIVIGVLVAAVILIGGYYLIKNNTAPVAEIPGDQTAGDNVPAPVLTLGAPKVETSQNATVSISTALVNGQVIPNGVPTSYWFEYGTTTDLGLKTGRQQVGSGFSAMASPAYITGLKANTLYYFKLNASNNFGTTSGAIFSFKTNNAPAPVAAVPTARTNNATDIARTTATINGQVNPNGWQTTYWFEYGKDINLGNIDSVSLISDSGSLKSNKAVWGSLSGLEPLTKYYFRVNAQNQFGTVNGTILSFTTGGPVSPGTPGITTSQASNITSFGARLNGEVNPNGVITTYWFEYSEDSLLGNIIGSGTPVQTLNAGSSAVSVQADIAGLEKDTRYFFRLVGKNQYGTILGKIESLTTKGQ
ncbi:MAG TPA: hypothetical protein VJH06_01090 [Candidatus Paceibacterota bacterium]